MAKANKNHHDPGPNPKPRNPKAMNLKLVESQFDKTISTLDNMSDAVKPLMPLVAESLQLSKNIVKQYKEAFLKGLEYAK